MVNGETGIGKGMEDVQLEQPALRQGEHSRPGDPMFLAPMADGQSGRDHTLERLFICLFALNSVIISSANLFHSEQLAHIVLPLQAYRCLYPLEP
jgi:hypothetical protein